MATANTANSLRTILLVDALACGALGAVLVPGAGLIATVTTIPAALLFYAGLLLLPIAAFMAFAATRALGSPSAVWLEIAGNLLWVAASVALMVGDWISPNLLGHAFIAAQALVVAALAALEHAALRRLSSGPVTA